jgi:hypothetical protein
VANPAGESSGEGKTFLDVLTEEAEVINSRRKLVAFGEPAKVRGYAMPSVPRDWAPMHALAEHTDGRGNLTERVDERDKTVRLESEQDIVGLACSGGGNSLCCLLSRRLPGARRHQPKRSASSP